MKTSSHLQKLIESKVLVEQAKLYAREAKELETKAAILIFSKLMKIYLVNLYSENQPKESKLKNTLQGFSQEISALIGEMRHILYPESHARVCKMVLYLMIDGSLL